MALINLWHLSNRLESEFMQPLWPILELEVSLTVSPSMQTVKGMMRMYHPAQNPATGKPRKIRMRNQMIIHSGLALSVPEPDPEPILSASGS